MIQAPLRSIDAPLQNPFFKTCEQNLPHVGDTVLITVPEIHDVGAHATMMPPLAATMPKQGGNPSANTMASSMVPSPLLSRRRLMTP